MRAWLLLGELKPAGATELLLVALNRIDREDGDEAASAVLPKVFGMIGREAVPALDAVVRDESRGIWSRWAAADGLSEIGCACPDARGGGGYFDRAA